MLTGAYLAIWAATLLPAAAVALLARGPARELMGLALHPARNPPPGPGAVLSLTAHNLPICGWPLLIGSLRVGDRPSWRALLDVTLAACALANILPVACALGAYGGALLPYMPQLPLEWGALAVGYGSWLLERRRALSRARRLQLLGVLAALALAAGVLETYAVPHGPLDPTRATDRARINNADSTGRVGFRALVFAPQHSSARSINGGPRRSLECTPVTHPCHGRLGR
jgi:hypothetical protein